MRSSAARRLDGVDVLRIEYYPARLFSHEQETQQKRAAEGRVDRREDVEAAMERLMNKVALVTLWVAPASRQIVKYTFDNVNFDFLPASWLLRVNDIKATMTMGQPFPGRVVAARRGHAVQRHARDRAVDFAVPARLPQLS